MRTLPGSRRLSAVSLVLFASLGAAGHAQQPENAEVIAGSFGTAARACAARGFAYVVHIDGPRFYCLHGNPLNEPEAIPVLRFIEHVAIAGAPTVTTRPIAFATPRTSPCDAHGPCPCP